MTVSVNWYIIDIFLFQLTGLSVSSGSDQLIVFHLTDGNDLVVCLVTVSGEERVGEVVGLLAKLWKKK